MLQNLVPKRKFTYIFDCWHLAVAQHYTSLEWERNRRATFEEEEIHLCGSQTSREVALLGVMSVTGLPAMTVPGAQVLDIPISVTPPF